MRSPDDPDDTRGRMAFARRMAATALGVDELPPDADVEMSIDGDGNCQIVGTIVTNAIWGFIEAHPGCVVKSDSGDALWCTRDITDEDRALWSDGCYRQVGALWDVLTAARDRCVARADRE